MRIFELENAPGHGLDDVGVALLDVEQGLAELGHRRRVRRPTLELAKLDEGLRVPLLQKRSLKLNFGLSQFLKNKDYVWYDIKSE